MSAPITFRILGEPIAKGRPRFMRKTGMAFTPERTRNYEAVLKHEALSVMGGREPLDGALEARIEAVFGIPASWSKKRQAMAEQGLIRPTGRPDLDNLAKCIGDAGNDVIWRDDSQIVEMTVCKRYGRVPCLILMVTEALERATARTAASGRVAQ